MLFFDVLFCRSVKGWKPLSSVQLSDTMTQGSSSPLNPGVKGAVLRGQTSLVLTHSYGLFSW